MDYPTSTQKHKWTFTKEQLQKSRNNTEQHARIRMLIFDEMVSLASRLNARQRVIATSQVYMSRMLVKTHLGEINPYLLMATCVYVACRAEEQPIHLRTVCSEARQQWPNFMPLEPWHLAECEFYLLQELETCLVVHQPYLPLSKLGQRFSLSHQETQACWALINDTYACDIPLIYSPSEIAFCAVYMVLVLKPNLETTRNAESVKKRLENMSMYMAACKQLNLRSVMGCIQEVLSLYALRSAFRGDAVGEELRKLM